MMYKFKLPIGDWSGDPELKLSVMSEEDMPTFRQGFGYGLFE